MPGGEAPSGTLVITACGKAITVHYEHNIIDYAILYYTILYYTMLYHAILYYTILYYTIQYNDTYTCIYIYIYI